MLDDRTGDIRHLAGVVLRSEWKWSVIRLTRIFMISDWGLWEIKLGILEDRTGDIRQSDWRCFVTWLGIVFGRTGMIRCLAFWLALQFGARNRDDRWSDWGSQETGLGTFVQKGKPHEIWKGTVGDMIFLRHRYEVYYLLECDCVVWWNVPMFRKKVVSTFSADKS